MKTYKQRAREALAAQQISEAKVGRLEYVLRTVAAHVPESRELIHEMTRPRYAEMRCPDGRVFMVRTG